MLEQIIEELIEEKYAQKLRLYSCRLDQSGESFHIEIELDGISDPKGAVSLGQCIEFSRAFAAHLDRLLEDAESGASLPEGLHPENYSLGVSSAGATRAIRIPDDLERFSGLPIRLSFRNAGGEAESNLCHEICLYRGQSASGCCIFESYRQKVKKRKKGKKKEVIRRFEVLPEDIQSAHLFLDS